MKRILALILVIISFSSLFMAGCKKDSEEDSQTTTVTENEKPTSAPVVHPEGFEPHVSADSEITGTWMELLSEDGYHYNWTFFSKTGEQAKLHHTKVFDSGVETSDIGYYNFNEETGTLTYYFISLSETTTTTATVKIEGNKLTLTPENGTAIVMERVVQ